MIRTSFLTAAVLAIACTSANGAPAPPRAPAISGPATASTFAPGDSLPYVLTWGPGARATGYRVTVTANMAGWSGLPTNQATTAQTLGFIAVAPTAGWETVTFTASVVSTQGSKVSSPTTRSWTATRGPGPPGPIVVDSSQIPAGPEVEPDEVSVMPGDTVQFCAFVRFKGGVLAMRAQDRPQCSALYEPAGVLPTPAQQAIADLYCVQWKATGGTISAGGCDTVPSGLEIELSTRLAVIVASCFSDPAPQCEAWLGPGGWPGLKRELLAIS